MALWRSRNVAAVVLIVALAFGVGSSAVLAPEVDARVSASTLTVVDGAVLISHGAAEFTSAREGDVLVAGDTLRTGPGSAAEITYFEGSSVRLEADTEISSIRSAIVQRQVLSPLDMERPPGGRHRDRGREPAHRD